MKATKVLAVLGITVIFTAGLTGCGKKKGSAKEDEKVETIFAVNCLKAVPRNLDNYLEFGGNVQTAASVDVYPDVQSGKISRILVKVGDKVKKDQVLCEVDASRPSGKLPEHLQIPEDSFEPYRFYLEYLPLLHQGLFRIQIP